MKYLKLFESIDNQYSVIISPNLYHPNVYYTGMEIDEITCESIKIYFKIQVEEKEWGINGIHIYDITGPSKIDLNISYYKDDNEDTEPTQEIYELPMDWSDVSNEIEKGKGVVTIDSIEIELINESSWHIGKSGLNTDKGIIKIKKVQINTTGL